jgi:osmotically-inducible protein OsmY
MKHGRFIILLLFIASNLISCISTVWTGASLVYDRHNMYKKLNDYNLLKQTNDVLAVNRTFNNSECVLDIAAFNGDILLAGHVPTEELMRELRERMKAVAGFRHLFNEVAVMQTSSNGIQDSWITTKIRSQIFADDSIDPNSFKVITSDRIVYLMGDVKPEEAAKVVTIARSVQGVERVVKLMKYFTYKSGNNVA